MYLKNQKDQILKINRNFKKKWKLIHSTTLYEFEHPGHLDILSCIFVTIPTLLLYHQSCFLIKELARIKIQIH